MMHGLIIVLLTYAVLAVGGCGLADIQAQNRATEEENKRVYGIYQSYMKSMNEQRVNYGMTTEPIKSFEEWKKSPGTE